MVLDVVSTKATEETNSSGGGVEMRETVLLDCLPVTGRTWVYGGGFENGRSYTVRERPVDDIRMTSDPTDIGHTSEAIIFMDVKDVLVSESGTEEVSTGGMYHSFGFSSRSGGL